MPDPSDASAKVHHAQGRWGEERTRRAIGASVRRWASPFAISPRRQNRRTHREAIRLSIGTCLRKSRGGQRHADPSAHRGPNLAGTLSSRRRKSISSSVPSQPVLPPGHIPGRRTGGRGGELLHFSFPATVRTVRSCEPLCEQRHRPESILRILLPCFESPYFKAIPRPDDRNFIRQAEEFQVLLGQTQPPRRIRFHSFRQREKIRFQPRLIRSGQQGLPPGVLHVRNPLEAPFGVQPEQHPIRPGHADPCLAVDGFVPLRPVLGRNSQTLLRVDGQFRGPDEEQWNPRPIALVTSLSPEPRVVPHNATRCGKDTHFSTLCNTLPHEVCRLWITFLSKPVFVDNLSIRALSARLSIRYLHARTGFTFQNRRREGRG